MLIKRERLEALAVGEPDACLADGGEDFGVVGTGGVHDGAVGHAYGEDIVFDCASPVETPLVFGNGGGEPALAVVLRVEVRDDAFAVLGHGCPVFFGEGVELAGHFVAEAADVTLSATGFFFSRFVGGIGGGVAFGGACLGSYRCFFRCHVWVSLSFDPRVSMRAGGELGGDYGKLLFCWVDINPERLNQGAALSGLSTM
jgi:hypothetical protein